VSTIPHVIDRLESAFDSRARRMLLSLAAAAVLTAGIIATVHRDDTPSAAAGAAHKLPTIAQLEQQKYGDPITPSREAMATAQTFISGAVLRNDLSGTFGLTTEKLRGGLTRDQWMSGSIPIVPYSKDDFGKAGIQIVRARERSIMLLVLITPKKGSSAPQQDYYLELVPSGGRWLVNYWAPKGHIDGAVPLAKP